MKLRTLIYPYTNVCLICFSVNSHVSFKNIRRIWAPEVSYSCNFGGHKLDRYYRAVQYQEKCDGS